jgi:hypothetical protein
MSTISRESLTVPGNLKNGSRHVSNDLACPAAELKFIRDFSTREGTWIDWMDMYTRLLRRGRIGERFVREAGKPVQIWEPSPSSEGTGRRSKVLVPKLSKSVAGLFCLSLNPIQGVDIFTTFITIAWLPFFIAERKAYNNKTIAKAELGIM